MLVSDYDYHLPPEQIAQHPHPERDGARLLVLDRSAAGQDHRAIRDLPSLLAPGSLLVVNDTRVIAARMFARKPTGGRVELFRIERAADGRAWRCLHRSSKALKPGTLSVERAPDLTAEILSVDGEYATVVFSPEAQLEQAGEVPLPPYITRDEGRSDPGDRERYQTVFARVDGAVAAPTAGLHFTPTLLEALAGRGVERCAVTLHVGPGTFAPLRSERVDDNRLHAERYEVSEAAADALNRARAEGRSIVAVGTTVARTLESSIRDDGKFRSGTGSTDLFIRPGFRFRAVDALITNFHLPRSSLLMLVSALAGRERILSAYAEAVQRGYRFFSYGDATLIR
jgi:S-adenosylmethionine:tRNA ribosyltransferase-isomerase